MKKLITLILCVAMLAPSAYATEIANEQSALAAASYMLDAAQEAELLHRINEARPAELEMIILEYRDWLDIDFENYAALTASKQNEVLKQCVSRSPYHDLDEFCNSFNNAIAAVKAQSGADGGGSGGSRPTGGGGYSPISTYTLDTNKNPLFEAPEEGTDIIYTIQPRFQGTPCRYAVAIYDENNTLTDVKSFNSQATQKNESEFFDFPTKYYENRNIKIMSLDSGNLSKPVDAVLYSNFCADGEGIPTPEAETEGITAYRGTISEYSVDSYTIDVHDMRAFGYWGSNPEEGQIEVLNPTPELVLYGSNPETVYNLKSDGETVTLDSVDTDGEIISFTWADLVYASLNRIAINKNDTEITYSLSPSARFFENYIELTSFSSSFFHHNMYFTALVQDEKVTAIHGLSFTLETVDAVCDGQLILNGEAYSSEYVIGELPAVGDEAFIEYIGETPRITKHTPVVGTFTADGIVCNGKTYYWSGIEYGDYLPGETCLAFIEPYGDTILIIKGNPSAISTVYATALNENILKTDIGDIDLSADNVQAYLWGSEVENGDFPCALMCETYGENMRISGMPVNYVQGTYSAVTNSIGGYVINDDTEITAVNSLGVLKNISLTSGYQYNAKIYSDDGITADIVLINDPSNSIGLQTVYMIADYYEDGKLYGYINGEYTYIEADYPASCGDLLMVKKLESDNKALDLSVVFNSANMGMEITTTRLSGIVQLPVTTISGDILVETDQNGNRYMQKITSETEIYKFDTQDCTLSLASSDDIFYNPTYPESGDFVIVRFENSVAKQIMIIK